MNNSVRFNNGREIGNENEEEYKALQRLLERSFDFNITFVVCEDSLIENEIKERLKMCFDVKESCISKNDEDIFLFLEKSAKDMNPNQSLFVISLHSLIASKSLGCKVLGNLNLNRNSLAEFLSFPVVFWISPGDEKRFISYAPDFWSWRGSCFYFRRFCVDRELDFYSSTYYSYSDSLRKIESLQKNIDEMEKDPYQTISLKKRMANLHLEIAVLFRSIEKYNSARNKIRIANIIFSNAGDFKGETDCLFAIGQLHSAELKNSEAIKFFKEALVRYKREGSILGEADCILSIGDIHFCEFRNWEAEKSFKEALTLYKKARFVLGEANSGRRIGNILFRELRYEEAMILFKNTASLYKLAGSIVGEANCIKSAGDILFAESSYKEAQTCFENASSLYKKAGFVLGEANCIKGKGMVLVRNKKLSDGITFFKMAESLYRQINDTTSIANCEKALAAALKG